MPASEVAHHGGRSHLMGLKFTPVSQLAQLGVDFSLCITWVVHPVANLLSSTCMNAKRNKVFGK